MENLNNNELKFIYDNCLAELSYWSTLDACYKKLIKMNRGDFIPGLTNFFITKLNISLDDFLANFTALYHQMFVSVDYIPSEFVIPNNIDTIQGIPFLGLNSLTKLSVPETVKEIQVQNGAFLVAACPNLTKVSLPACVTEMAANTFINCKQLKTIVLSPGCKQIKINANMNIHPDAIFYLQSPQTEVEVIGNWSSEDDKDEWVAAHIVAAY